MKKPYKTLGDALKFHREKMGLSRQDVAKLLNVTASLVAKWEGNLRSCKNRLPELCKYYHVPIEELLMSYKYSKKEMKTQEEKLEIVHKRCLVLCVISLSVAVFVASSLLTNYLYLNSILEIALDFSDKIKALSISSKMSIIKWHLSFIFLTSIFIFVVNLLIETFAIVQRRKLIEENLERLKE